MSQTFKFCPLFRLMSCMNSYINVLFGSGCSHNFRGTATWFSIANNSHVLPLETISVLTSMTVFL